MPTVRMGNDCCCTGGSGVLPPIDTPCDYTLPQTLQLAIYGFGTQTISSPFVIGGTFNVTLPDGVICQLYFDSDGWYTKTDPGSPLPVSDPARTLATIIPLGGAVIFPGLVSYFAAKFLLAEMSNLDVCCCLLNLRANWYTSTDPPGSYSLATEGLCHVGSFDVDCTTGVQTPNGGPALDTSSTGVTLHSIDCDKIFTVDAFAESNSTDTVTVVVQP